MKHKVSWKLVGITFISWLFWVLSGLYDFILLGIAEYVGADGQLSLQAKNEAMRMAQLYLAGMISFGAIGFGFSFFWRNWRKVLTVVLTAHIILTLVWAFIFFRTTISSVVSDFHVMMRFGGFIVLYPLLFLTLGLNLWALRILHRKSDDEVETALIDPTINA